MENNKKKVTPIICSILLLLVFIGAAFAYFGTFSEDVSNKLKVNITIDEGSESTFVSSGVNLELTVPARNMTEFVAGNESMTTSNSTYLNVTLTSGSSNVSSTCTYDIAFEYASDSSIYGQSPTIVTDTSQKEFTLTITGSTGTNNYGTEKNFNYDTSNGWTGKTTNNNEKRIIVSNATISDASTTGTTKSWNIAFKFYNLTIDQNQLAGKTFKGTFYVENVSCSNSA
ncbi:MAG: hypothetical protein ACI4XR_02360 [Bacilli bacterium]